MNPFARRRRGPAVLAALVLSVAAAPACGTASPEDAAPPGIVFVVEGVGAGLALAAAELLPERTLERIVLLAPAVSPDYDLRPALRATRGEIVSFNSVHDSFILNWGTRQFGTVDRVYGPSAGCRGFVPPAGADDGYARLVQVAWRPGMILAGHCGSHLGSSMPGFLGKEVAPWLKTRAGGDPPELNAAAARR